MILELANGWFMNWYLYSTFYLILNIHNAFYYYYSFFIYTLAVLPYILTFTHTPVLTGTLNAVCKVSESFCLLTSLFQFVIWSQFPSCVSLLIVEPLAQPSWVSTYPGILWKSCQKSLQSFLQRPDHVSNSQSDSQPGSWLSQSTL